MTVTGFVTIGGAVQSSGTFAAFAGTEVRGVQDTPSLVPFGPYKGVSLYLTMVYADSDGETISFKIGSTSLAQTVTYAKDANFGNVMSPLMLSDATLASSATQLAQVVSLSPPKPSATALSAYGFTPTQYAATMTVTGFVTIGGAVQSSGTFAAFAGTEVRGVQDTPSVVPFGPYKGVSMYLTMVYADNDGDAISFKFGDTALTQTMVFVKDSSHGNVMNPIMFTA